jgi:hypothetical protein
MSRALSEATPEDLADALAAERLPEPASTVLRDGSVRLIHLGEARARREIDQRFAEILHAIAERDRRIDVLEQQVAELRSVSSDDDREG